MCIEQQSEILILYQPTLFSKKTSKGNASGSATFSHGNLYRVGLKFATPTRWLSSLATAYCLETLGCYCISLSPKLFFRTTP